VLLELSWSLNTQAGPLRKHLLLSFSLPICNTEKSVSRQRISDGLKQHSKTRSGDECRLWQDKTVALLCSQEGLRCWFKSYKMRSSPFWFFNYCTHAQPKQIWNS
jgi:hypothetical protein